MYDGHGRDGDKCAHFARDNLPQTVASYVKRAKAREEKANYPYGGKPSAAENGAVKELELTKDQVQALSLKAHIDTNRAMHRSSRVDDSLSGTTSISMYLHGRRNRLTVSNVGDSRAILGQQIPSRMSNFGGGGAGAAGGGDASTVGAGTVDGGGTVGTAGTSGPSLRALPLSRDQTPYRRDERVRIRATGARILSLDQIEGLEPVHENEDEADEKWGAGGGGDLVLGEEIDEGGDPPRVWSPHGEYPGTAFTRSLGDSIAEDLGVFAEPESVTREIGQNDKIIVLASDGVFEFLTNQSVIDICAKFADPLEACRAVVAESYELWLQYELRTDDITMICIFVDEVEAEVTDTYRNMSFRLENANKSSLKATSEQMSVSKSDDDSVDAPLAPILSRPVRHKLSKDKSKAIEASRRMFISERDMSDVAEDDFDLSKLYTEKSKEEKDSISEAIRASVMFNNITNAQRELIFKVMEGITVKKGDWVIKQGSVGDRFYIVDEGKFEVRIIPEGAEDDNDETGGNAVHVYNGSRVGRAHPSFGELALMYSAPRAASIIAQTDGKLWALHRHAFKKVIAEQSARKGLVKLLSRVDFFHSLSREEMENVSACLTEATYERGHTIVQQGDIGETFYILGPTGECGELSLVYCNMLLLNLPNTFTALIIIFCVYICIAPLCSFPTLLTSERIEDIGGGSTSNTTLTANSFFGDEILAPGERKYAATVIVSTTTTCWKLEKSAAKKCLSLLRHKQQRGSSNIA